MLGRLTPGTKARVVTALKGAGHTGKLPCNRYAMLASACLPARPPDRPPARLTANPACPIYHLICQCLPAVLPCSGLPGRRHQRRPSPAQRGRG